MKNQKTKRVKALIINNKYLSITELAEILGMNYNTLKSKVLRCDSDTLLLNNLNIRIIR